MSFLTKLFPRPQNANTTPTMTPPSTPPTRPSYTTPELDDWELISAVETVGLHPDRITMFLGPRYTTRHNVLIADIPNSSLLLRKVSNQSPARRYLYLGKLNVSMVTFYLQHSITLQHVLAIEAPWLDIINLAITAEVLQDATVQNTAYGALRQKGVLADAPGNGLGWFKQQEYAVARIFYSSTGAGASLVAVLDQLQGRLLGGTAEPKNSISKTNIVGGLDAQNSLLRQLELQVVALRKACGVAVGQEKEGKEIGEEQRFRNSRLKVQKGVAKGLGGEMPSRQPGVPPRVEQLMRGEEKNFVWRE